MAALERRVRLPALGKVARARLWLSYQRYALLLLGGPALAVALAAAYAPWWVALLAGVVGIVPARFGLYVAGRWPRKLRATRVALARIDAGSFAPESVRGHCGDPCFRVVAREVLARAGVPRPERAALVHRFADEVRRERSVVVLFDHVRGTATILGGDARERT